ncbi:syntaxin-18 [Cylas formicarius]|uniref:syntaxin-18 n=1 Tax=Cylas formicarius TaxID=197179 RepID=UPI0029586F5C|nr:syntaxin-18 [Cylas formicarius]
MDVTLLFKACVKTVKTTNKNLALKDSKPNLLKVRRDVHLAKAKEIAKQITSLQDFLSENKAAYLNIINCLSTNKTMSQIDRDQVDSVAEDIVSKCSSLISEYKQEILVLHKSKQQEEHYKYVIESLEKYLKDVSKIYAEAKALRVKKVIDTHKLSKLELKPLKSKVRNPLDISGDAGSIKREIMPISTPPPEDYDTQLSPEDMQMLEAENEQLFNELNSISEEVRQMETKVVHIAELQELFTEKVLEQEKDIERIAETVVGATENVKDANEQIRQAIQRNAGLRAWVLFFLLVMSFSLLFLDWYND